VRNGFAGERWAFGRDGREAVRGGDGDGKTATAPGGNPPGAASWGGRDQRLAAPLRSRFGGLPGGEHEYMVMKGERGAVCCLRGRARLGGRVGRRTRGVEVPPPPAAGFGMTEGAGEFLS